MFPYGTTYLALAHQTEPIDPGLALVLVIGAIILFAMLFGGSDSSTPTQAHNASPNAAAMPANDRQAVESVILILGESTSSNRLSMLRHLYSQLPARIPEDRICALLDGMTNSVRLEALRLLRPKFPPNIPVPTAQRIVEPMTTQQRETAIALIYPHH